jgi:hypothetical protein
MPHLRKAGLMAFAFFALSFGGALTARADIIVSQSVNNQGTDNVLLNTATNVNTVTGSFNSGAVGVKFISATGNLSAEASGQAVVTAGSTNVDFSNIGFSLANNTTFTRAVFNLNMAYTGQVLITVTGVNINGGTYQDSFTVSANGQNFFTIDAINGQLMNSITLSAVGAGNEFEDLRQVRIGDAAAVPEPMTMLLFGTGLAGIAARVRRRRKAGKAAARSAEL